MMYEIFQKFDLDKDGFLNIDEFNTLQVATEGEEATYNLEQLTALLLQVNPDLEDPKKGMPYEDYRRLYVERRLRDAYSTDVTRDHLKIFGPGGGQAAAAVAAAAKQAGKEAEGDLAEGAVVRIEGLSGAVELNGREGHIVAPVDS